MTDAMDELKTLPNWVAYTDKKIPVNPTTGRPARSNDPLSWGNIHQAWRHKKRANLAGVGFMFTLGTGIVGVDLDDVFDEPGGELSKPWARDVVGCLSSYTEISPSGMGLHIYARGEIPSAAVKKFPDGGGFEMYSELRYFTVTGNRYGDNNQIEERGDVLAALHFTFAEELKPRPTNPTPAHLQQGPVSLRAIQTALTYIPPQRSYYEWLTTLMAIHSEMPGQDGIDMAERWSPGSRGEIAAKWRSFDSTARDGVTIGSLFHTAKLNGYQARSRQRKTTNRNGANDARGKLR